MTKDGGVDPAMLPEPKVPEGDGYRLLGQGSTVVPAAPEAIWTVVMDERRLSAAIPGAHSLRRVADPADHGFATGPADLAYAADVAMGIGPLKATYLVEVALPDPRSPALLRLLGGARGTFGQSAGEGFVALSGVEEGTRIDYRYGLLITGRIATVGGRLVEGLADSLIHRFFRLLSASADPLSGTREGSALSTDPALAPLDGRAGEPRPAPAPGTDEVAAERNRIARATGLSGGNRLTGVFGRLSHAVSGARRKGGDRDG